MFFVEWGGEFIVKPVEIEGFAIGPLRKVQEHNDEKVGFGKWIMGTQYQQNHIKTSGFSMIFMFANVWLFDDIFNSYELQEK